MAQRLLRDGEPLTGADISKDILWKKGRSAADLNVDKAAAYRARGRVAVAVSLWNGDKRTWEPGEAALRASTGTPLQVLSVWPREPLAPGASVLVVVVEATTPEEGLPPGPYTLTFGPEDGPSLVLTGVRFP